MSKLFVNNMDLDILHALKQSSYKLITSNMIKCSKSAVSNALYYVSRGETVYFVLGNIDVELPMITHCWVIHNDKIIHTRVPKDSNLLIPKFKLKLTSNDLTTSKKQILQWLTQIQHNS